MSARLDARTVIDLWDAGADRSPVDRAVKMAAGALGLSPDAAEELPIGQRDRLLLEVHSRYFGSVVEAVAACPACAELFEVSFDASAANGVASAPEPLISHSAGHEVAWRLPRSADLRAIEEWDDVDAARMELLRRCVIDARRGDELPATLPRGVVDDVSADMARADPLGAIWIGLTCDACGHAWDALFDPVEFLAAEIDAAARGVVEEVAALAAAFGWSESEILQMSAARRSRYLEMAP